MHIDVVTGFFESGKTTLVRNMVEKEALKLYKKILIINCEFGEKNYENMSFNNAEINVINLFNERDFTEEVINKYIEDFSPEYVVIEYNGVWDFEKLLSFNFCGKSYIRNIISTIDVNTFEMYFRNMERIIGKGISNSDIVVMTKTYKISEVEMDNQYSIIKSINKGCKVFLDRELFNDDESDLVSRNVTRSDFEVIKFIGLFFILNLIVLGIRFIFPEFYSDVFQRIIGITISLLIQIIPFLLIGAIISGMIQIFMPRQKFNRIFVKSDIKSIIISAFAGIFFPVCDCAMVPIATSIVKKGYSTPAAITFLLAAPAVNPIVIISTYYAFPNTPTMVVYRIVFGILIAIFTGVALLFMEKKSKDSVVRENVMIGGLSENYMDTLYFKSKIKYLEAILIHAKNEFFKIGFYVTIGAFISSTIQVVVPKAAFMQMNNINALAVFVMIIAAFFISVCSTSNAFIARSFINVMPQNALLAFMVMGPMIDVTNVSVMFGAFKKSFLIKLVLFLVYMAFIVFSLMGRFV